jgi:hypothetical protein
MRTAFALLLLTTPALAAPVKPDPKAERAKRKSLWTALQSRDPVTRTRAVLALIDHPNAVPFLADTLPPVKASKEQVTGWLRDLNSDDETLRNRALDELRYFDPRIALSVAEQAELVTTPPGRKLLLWLLRGGHDREPAGAEITSLRVTKENGTVIEVERGYRLVEDGRVSTALGSDVVYPLTRFRSPMWTGAGLAVFSLDRIGTPAARDLLKRLATGHPDAYPTRVAAAFSAHGPPAPLTEKRFDRIWQAFWEDNPAWQEMMNGDSFAATRGVLAMAADPKAVEFLKPKVLPIGADKKRTLAWLAALNSDDEKTWKPAYLPLAYHQPRLSTTFDEQLDVVRTHAGMYRLQAAYSPESADGAVQVYKQSVSLSIEGDWLVGTFAGGGKSKIRLQPLDELCPAPWRQVRLAVIALERTGTPEAVAVLQQLADGHPDVLPTKDAKAALKRLEK